MLFGMVGVSGSGKDQCAKFLIKNHGFVRVSFADALKRVVQEVFDFSDEQMHGVDKNTKDLRYEMPSGELLTARQALQLVGTQGFRAACPDIWAMVALRKAKEYNAQGVPVVITDVRFKNECEWVKEAGGAIVKLQRASTLDTGLAQHASETELQTFPESYFDYTIDNRFTTLADLEAAVTAVYLKCESNARTV